MKRNTLERVLDTLTQARTTYSTYVVDNGKERVVCNVHKTMKSAKAHALRMFNTGKYQEAGARLNK